MAGYAAVVAGKLPAAHARNVARKLLLTAATRGHTTTIWLLYSCKPVQQHLDAATVENLIVQLIQSTHFDGFKLVRKLPAALQLDSAAVARLLQEALSAAAAGPTSLR
jgi:hypothetical protein